MKTNFIMDIKKSGINKKIRKFRQQRLSADELVTRYSPTEEKLKVRSPVPISENGADTSPFLFLETLYKPDDCIFIGNGNHIDSAVLEVSHWLDIIDTLLRDESGESVGLPEYNYIIANPLPRTEAVAGNFKMMCREEEMVTQYRFTVLEFHDVGMEKQLAFCLYMLDLRFPVAAIINTGTQNIQCWLELNCQNRKEWEKEVEQLIFDLSIRQLGVDWGCHNAAMYSRFPGHFREDEQKWQRLLYLNGRKDEN